MAAKEDPEMFFKRVEDGLDITIPLFIKNICIMNGLTNPVVFSDFRDNDIDELELFVKNDLKDIITEEDNENYFGIFKNKPENFKFLIGHKKLLMKIAEYVTSYMTNKQSNNAASGSVTVQSNSGVINKGLDSQVEKVSADFNEQRKICTKLISDWMSNLEVEDSLKKKMVAKFRDTDCIIEIDGDSLSAKIPCILCNRVIKVNKIAKRKISRWVMSNFYSHFLGQHFQSYNGVDKDKSKDAQSNQQLSNRQLTVVPCTSKNKGQNSIRKYYHVIGSNQQSSSENVQKSHKKPGNSSSLDQLRDSSIPAEVGSSIAVAIEYQSATEVTGKNSEHTTEATKSDDTDSEMDSSFNKIRRKRAANRPICLDSSEHDTGEDEEENADDSENVNLDFQMDGATLTEACGSVSVNTMPQLQYSKWTQEKYSRRSRRLRSREKSVINQPKHQPLITNYMKELDEVTKMMKENAKLREMLLHQIELINNSHCLPRDKRINPSERETNEESPPNMHKKLLSHLADVAFANSKKSNNNRFDDQLKKFCVYLFIVGGRLVYETLHANLTNSIPSPSTVIRAMNTFGNVVEEGTLRFGELRCFLDSRNLIRNVWISEDATKVTGRIQYNSQNNKIVGFVIPLDGNGLPKTDYYIAASASQIQSYFLNETRSEYAYVIMAQAPVDRSPAFCLAIFGTDNCFTHMDVKNRWATIKAEAERYGITIMGFSSDGDTRCLKAMRQCSKLNINRNSENWPWYCMDFNTGDICIQDTVHIGTKLRTRLLKRCIELPMGKFSISISHVESLITTVSKDKHLLTMYDIRPEDKMNFRAIEKMSSHTVGALLLEHVPESDATVVYLKITRYVLESFLNKNLDVRQRIQFIWYAVFLLRMWRYWLQKNKNKSIQKNFVTSNAYICIELNAHALIKLTRQFRDKNNELTNEHFTPWLFSSQPCEQQFRSTRSLSSTFSTIVNFSILDIISRINKIQTINDIVSDVSQTYHFPREEKSTRLGSQSVIGQMNFLEDDELEATCMNALEEAKADCIRLGMDCPEEAWNTMMLKFKNDAHDDDDDDSDVDADDHQNYASSYTLTKVQIFMRRN